MVLYATIVRIAVAPSPNQITFGTPRIGALLTSEGRRVLANRIDCPCEIWFVTPERIESMPSVTRKEGTRSIVTEEPIGQADERARRDADESASERAERIDGQRRQDASQRHERADRKVDRADQNDHSFCKRHQQQHRRLTADVERVGRREEQRIDSGEVDDERND